MNDATRVDVSATESAPRDPGRHVAASGDASRADMQQTDVQPESVRGLGTLVAAVVFLLVAMLVTPLAIVATILLLGLIAGVVMSAVGAVGLMPMLGPLMLAVAIPAVIVAGLWWVLKRDSRPSVTHE